MHGDLLGLVLSVSLIAVCMAIAFLVSRFGKGRLGDASSEIARKIVHIGVSNWFFIYIHVFESDLWPIIGLGGFAVINLALNLSGGLSALMGQESKKRNWGLVQYPISVILMIVMKRMGVGDTVCIGCGLLGMGYGDGLAALVGRSVKSMKFGLGGKKSIVGSLTMAVVTFVVVVLLKSCYAGVEFGLALVLVSLLCAVAATLVEAFTPFGLDNLTVPLAIYFLAGLV